MGAGRIRFMRGPSLATADFTYRLSTSTSSPCSWLRWLAFCNAERRTFSTSGATDFLVNATVFSASSTPRPLIRSSTSRAFCGDTR